MPSSVDSTKIVMGEVVDRVAFLLTVGDIGFGVRRIFVDETMSYFFVDGNIGPIILPMVMTNWKDNHQGTTITMNVPRRNNSAVKNK